MFGEESRVSGAAQGARRAGAKGRPLPLPLVNMAASPNGYCEGGGGRVDSTLCGRQSW